MPMIYECNCGKKIGVFVPTIEVGCKKCRRAMIGRSVTDEEMRKAFPTKKKRAKKLGGARK